MEASSQMLQIDTQNLRTSRHLNDLDFYKRYRKNCQRILHPHNISALHHKNVDYFLQAYFKTLQAIIDEAFVRLEKLISDMKVHTMLPVLRLVYADNMQARDRLYANIDKRKVYLFNLDADMTQQSYQRLNHIVVTFQNEVLDMVAHCDKAVLEEMTRYFDQNRRTFLQFTFLFSEDVLIYVNDVINIIAKIMQHVDQPLVAKL